MFVHVFCSNALNHVTEDSANKIALFSIQNDGMKHKANVITPYKTANFDWPSP